MKSSNKAKLFAAAALFLIASVSLCLLVSCGENEAKPDGNKESEPASESASEPAYEPVSEETAPGAEHAINYDLGDNGGYFIETPGFAKAGEPVELRLKPTERTAFHIYISNAGRSYDSVKRVPKSYDGDDYTGYTFIMPDNDVVVNVDVNTVYPADGMEWVLETYYSHLENAGLLAPGVGSAADLYIQHYVGTFGDGCVVAYMGGDDLCYTELLRPETYGSHTITFPNGQKCYAFYNNEALTIGQAYERGILSDNDILVIDAEVGTYGQTPGRFDWVLETYREYLKSEYHIESAPYLRIDRYVGTFGDGCIVAYMGGDGIDFTDAERTETYGNHTITFPNGQICYAFYNNEALTIGQAYERGILSDNDILVIDAEVGTYGQTPGRFDWVLETYREYLKSKYYIESAPYLRFRRYVGTFGDGCVVAYMCGDDITYADESRTETYGSHTITFPSGEICYAFYNNEVLTIGQAYERGILSDDDILIINAAVGMFVQ